MKQAGARAGSVLLLFLVFLVALVDCGPPNVDLPPGNGSATDSGAAAVDGPCNVTPIVASGPKVVPYGKITVKGRANGATRVYVTGGPNPIAAEVGSDGTFCADIPVATPSENTFTVSVQCTNGKVSPRTATVTAASDGNAQAVDAPLCDGSPATAARCEGAELCKNGKDDNCDGLTDDKDPTCNAGACKGDALGSPDANAPVLQPGKYASLKLCPRTVAYFGVQATRNQNIRATISMKASAGLLDLFLLDVDGRTLLTSNEETNDVKTLNYGVSTDGGKFLLQVTGRGDASNSYTLELAVTGP